MRRTRQSGQQPSFYRDGKAVAAISAKKDPTDVPGYIGRIPVRNLWLLMLYASDLFRERGTGKVGLEDTPEDLPDLVAAILVRAVERRQRRRLSLGYRSREATLTRIRGSIDLLRANGTPPTLGSRHDRVPL